MKMWQQESQEELKKFVPKDLYMVIASFRNAIRNNLEIVDYNLTLREAEQVRDKLSELVDEDWQLDDDFKIRIVEQGEEI